MAAPVVVAAGRSEVRLTAEIRRGQPVPSPKRGHAAARVRSPSFPGVAGLYDPRTALVVVDVQNDFADPDGSLYVRDADSVIDVANAEIARRPVPRGPC